MKTNFIRMKNRKIEGQNVDELRFENELLKLKIQAEFGAAHIGSSNNIPPEIENFFLKNVINIENAFAKQQTISLYDKIGRPPIIKSEDLDDIAIEHAQISLQDLLAKKGIFITFSANETFRDKYIFITEKLFHVQVDNLGMPEVMMHFNCVDFEDEDFEDTDFEE